MIGIASVASKGSATKVPRKYGAEFPNAVDAGGATFALWEIPRGRSYGFVIDESGKVVCGYDLIFDYDVAGERVAGFLHDGREVLEGARDPFGISEVPPACRKAYSALKVGSFARARVFAAGLAASSDGKVKDVAQKIIAAADETEKSRIAAMEKLAEDGRAGELHEDVKAFLAAFPNSREKSKLRSLRARVSARGNGRKEGLAAANFERAVGFLKKNQMKPAMQILSTLGAQLKGTFHGELSGRIAGRLAKADG